MKDQKTYRPIDCEFHDELEAASTLRRVATLVLEAEDGSSQTVHDVIVDLGIFEVDGMRAEYMILASGRKVRMDRILSIDGKLRPK